MSLSESASDPYVGDPSNQSRISAAKFEDVKLATRLNFNTR